MSDRARVMALRAIAALGTVLAVLGFGWSVLLDGTSEVTRGSSLIGLPIVAVFVSIVWIAAPRQPRNALLWVLAAFVLTLGSTPFTEALVAYTDPSLPIPLTIDLVPADLPRSVAWTTGWSYALSSLGFFGMLTFGFLLFPDGHLPSQRWRPIAYILAIGLVANSTVQIVSWLPRLTVAPEDNPLFSASVLFVIFGPPLGLASLVHRYRIADTDVRAKIKWIILGAAVTIPLVVVSLNASVELLTVVGLLVLLASYGIAITRHRLFDVDVVISKTLVFGSLAVFIGVVYVGVVVGIGSLVGSGEEPNAALSIGATALVAVAFQPLRRRMERLANRVVFGRRATPYEVLSEFSHRVAVTSDDLLGEAARSLAEGTRADRVVVSVRVGGESVEAAAWPVDSDDTPSGVVSFPIEDGDLVLGSLDVFLPVGQPLQDDDRRLAEQLASGMGLALRNQLLTERLEARVEELRESRRRLVAVQDETRRRLERDLHDGAQQQLVALKVKLGLGRAIAEKDGAVQTAEMLGRLSSEADQAVDAMREFARGVYPPLLEAEGLASAIGAHARRAPIPVDVEVDGVGRYPRDVEATVYFCVLEALRNTIQHARATRATVTLAQADGWLEFQVSDDGIGFDPRADSGIGLTAMADRLDALAGELTIHSEPGNGTTLSGQLPLRVGALA